jgi:hypothetical protein
MKRAISAFAASILAGAMSSVAMAQAGPNPVSNLDYHFLDEHPEVARQISANPSLVDNPQYLANHRGLRQYFASHPEVAQDIKTHPYNFMHHEDQFLANHGMNPPDGWGNEGAVGRFDQGYLDQHQEVAQQLASNPDLIDNPRYLANHPGLQEYLNSHPGIRQDLRQHPYKFMKSEDQLNGYGPRNGPLAPYASSDNFLTSHPEVEQQLNRNPKLVDNPQYLAQHPGLEDYLKAHPYAQKRWDSHPYAYMHREDQYQRNHKY